MTTNLSIDGIISNENITNEKITIEVTIDNCPFSTTGRTHDLRSVTYNRCGIITQEDEDDGCQLFGYLRECGIAKCPLKKMSFTEIIDMCLDQENYIPRI
jgi:hypothetical protein